MARRKPPAACSPGQPVADGEAGELQRRGRNVLAPYLNNPQATAQARTVDGWFR